MAAQINILLVDDDQDICAFMETMLVSSGYRVTTLSNPADAIDRIRSETFHVMVVDLMMPEMDGIELIRHVRKIDTDIAIMVFTGYPSVDTAVAALKLDVTDYIKKPFEVEVFREKLAEVLRKKGLLVSPEAELHKTIGESIRRLRKERSLTLKQLARRTSLSVSLLSQIERAESSASVSSLYKVSTALQVRLREIFGDF